MRNIAEYFQKCTDVLEESLIRDDSANSAFNSTGVSLVLNFK